MTGKPIVVVGAGGFGREAVDVIEAINATSDTPVWNLKGVYDDAPSEANLLRLKARRIPYLGPIPLKQAPNNADFVIAIGNPRVREMLAERIENVGWSAATLLHPNAVIGSVVEIGLGTVVCGGVLISTNVRLGRHVHLNPRATVGHDTHIGDFVSVNPAATVSGDVHIERGTLIGASATVLQALKIRQGSVVGASACVVRDVEKDTVVKGVPAR